MLDTIVDPFMHVTKWLRHLAKLRAIVTPTIYLCLVEFLHIDSQNTGQILHHESIYWDHHNVLLN